jgi:hypothetical protein
MATNGKNHKGRKIGSTQIPGNFPSIPRKSMNILSTLLTYPSSSFLLLCIYNIPTLKG